MGYPRTTGKAWQNAEWDGGRGCGVRCPGGKACVLTCAWSAQLVGHQTAEREVADWLFGRTHSQGLSLNNWYCDYAGCTHYLVSDKMVASLSGNAGPLVFSSKSHQTEGDVKEPTSLFEKSTAVVWSVNIRSWVRWVGWDHKWTDSGFHGHHSV